MKILIAACVPRERKGGVASTVYNIGEELERFGHTVTYIFLDDLISPGAVSPRFLELIFSSRLARYIVRNRDKFSLVNLHAPAGFVYGLIRKWLPGTNWPPYIMTLHGLEERRMHVMSREQKKGRAWNYNWKNRLWHRVYHFPRFRGSIYTTQGVHVCARDVASYLQLYYNLDAERLSYICHGVEARFFTSRQYCENGRLRLLYAGTWLDQRGIFYIRDALRSIAERLPGLTMTFAGTGTSAEEIGCFFGSDLQERIIVQPVVASDRMPELYSEHDVFVFPSLMEGLPCVVLEAMASGMPVITTETCGMPDVIEDNFNGLLIPPGDAAALEEAIVRLASSDTLRERLGRAAQDSMRRYSWERAARAFESLCRRVLAAEGRKES
jgi:glycosyltransferase involved in cell wall biosynthesis